MRRRVLVLPSAYPSDEAPVDGVFVEDQARVLSEAYDVRVLTQRPFGWRHVLSGTVPRRGSVSVRNGVTVRRQRVAMPPRLARRGVLARQLAVARRAVVEWARDWGMPDVIHAHVVLPAGWIAARLGRELDIAVVLTEHTGPFATHLASAEQRALVDEALAQVDRILAVSPALASEIRAVAPGAPLDVVGNVVLTRYFTPPRPPDAPRAAEEPLRLFSAALLYPPKGFEHLLQAARVLLDSGFGRFTLEIAGDGPDRARLERIAADLNLVEHCKFLGMLSREALRSRMQACVLFVLPSLAETFGLVIGEAMACGKPVVATKCGGPEFQVGPECGVLVAPGDARALADAIRHVAGRLHEFPPAGIRAWVTERFGESAFLDSIGAAYDELCARRRAESRPAH